MDTGFWAYKYIEYCHKKGVVAGYDDGLYHPGDSVDRTQIAVYMARTLAGGDAKVPEPDPERNPSFPDVPKEFWAYKYIEYCHTHGIVQGYGDNKYHPEIILTRDQMALFITRTFNLPVSNETWNTP